uniref:Uncharacterized protein n=1 Tax=Varanus komodoensis TaxID=61221 RepID=A0A8D2J3D0_VARKO
MLAETAYCLQIFGFSTGCAGCLLTVLTMKCTDWRLWHIEKNSMPNAGLTRVGIWKICFPPTSKGSNGYSVLCCKEFDFYEKFFPVAMKVSQVFMFIALFLASLGLVLSFLIPWNVFCRCFTRMQARCFIASGGFFILLSSICVFIPITWNVYSVSVNEIIHFPDDFHLPPRFVPLSTALSILTFHCIEGKFIAHILNLITHLGQYTQSNMLIFYMLDPFVSIHQVKHAKE